MEVLGCSFGGEEPTSATYVSSTRAAVSGNPNDDRYGAGAQSKVGIGGKSATEIDADRAVNSVIAPRRLEGDFPALVESPSKSSQIRSLSLKAVLIRSGAVRSRPLRRRLGRRASNHDIAGSTPKEGFSLLPRRASEALPFRDGWTRRNRDGDDDAGCRRRPRRRASLSRVLGARRRICRLENAEVCWRVAKPWKTERCRQNPGKPSAVVAWRRRTRDNALSGRRSDRSRASSPVVGETLGSEPTGSYARTIATLSTSFERRETWIGPEASTEEVASALQACGDLSFFDGADDEEEGNDDNDDDNNNQQKGERGARRLRRWRHRR